MPPDIAELIRTGRIRKGLNQEDLAQKSGVSRTTLHHIERGTHKPRASTLSRLAKTLDIDPHSLARGWQREPMPPVNGKAHTNGSGNHSQPATPQSEFDWHTNRAIATAKDQSPERFAEFSAEDWEALVSLLGVGGGLTVEGVMQAADQIQSDRETLARLRVVLQTHLREPARKLVEALYQSVLIGDEAVMESAIQSESP